MQSDELCSSLAIKRRGRARSNIWLYLHQNCDEEHMKRLTNVFIHFCVIFSALVLTACGGGGSGSSPEPSSPSTSTPTPLGPQSLSTNNKDFVQGQALQFSVTGIGSQLTYQWDFGDGQQFSGGPMATHTFQKPGDYTINVLIRDGDGKTTNATLQLTVMTPTPYPPDYSTSSRYSVPQLKNSIIKFNRPTSTFESDYTYSWDFGDGNKSLGSTAQHSFNSSGDFTVTLTLTDRYKRTTSTSQKLRISDVELMPLLSPLGGPGSQNAGLLSRFRSPTGVAVAADGDVFVADSGNNVIRRIARNGEISDFAGTSGFPGGQDGTGVNSRFNRLQKIAFDSQGNLYVIDRGIGLRKITPQAEVSTILRNDYSAPAVDGPVETANLRSPQALAVDKAGAIYLSDGASVRLLKDGRLTTVAGNQDEVGRQDGPALQARFGYIAGLALDANGQLFINDYCPGVRKLSTDGVVSTVVEFENSFGNGRCIPSKGGDETGDLIVKADGSIFFTKMLRTDVQVIKPGGVTSTFSGHPYSYGAVDGPSSINRFAAPNSLALDAAGQLLVTDTRSHTIRRLKADGFSQTIGGSSPFDLGNYYNAPLYGPKIFRTGQMARAANGDIYFGSYNAILVLPYGSTDLRVFAGNQDESDRRDGSLSNARFEGVDGVIFDSKSNLYVADNRTIRKITPDGQVTTIVSPSPTGVARDGQGIGSDAYACKRLAIDAADNLYAVCGYSRLIKVSPQGMVTTLVGAPKDSTQKYDLHSLVIGKDQKIYFSTSSGIEIVDQDGKRTPWVGNNPTPYTNHGDGIGKEANIGGSFEMTVDGDGNIWILDVSSPIKRLRIIDQNARVETRLEMAPLRLEIGLIKQYYEFELNFTNLLINPDGVVYFAAENAIWRMNKLPPAP
ncbi:PKD domain-containing protein [Roseateles sp. BYS180W]|uniref:PKD domain-containing protein n=1 Tax=Roseateles rivi TaxID=3299028 RepID=A0ABW7FVG8_9BURK